MVVIKTNRGREMSSGQIYNARFNTRLSLLFDKAGKRIY